MLSGLIVALKRKCNFQARYRARIRDSYWLLCVKHALLKNVKLRHIIHSISMDLKILIKKKKYLRFQLVVIARATKNIFRRSASRLVARNIKIR